MREFKSYFIFIVILSVIVSCSGQYEDIIFIKVRKIEIKDIKDGKILATADALFQNPNDEGGKVKRVDIDVSVDGENAARILRDSPFKVKGNSEFTIPLDMEIRADMLAKNVLGNIFSKKEKSIPLDFDGFIWVSVYGVRKKVPVKYKAELNIRL